MGKRGGASPADAHGGKSAKVATTPVSEMLGAVVTAPLPAFHLWRVKVLDESRAYYENRSENWMTNLYSRCKECAAHPLAHEFTEQPEQKMHAKLPWHVNPKETCDKFDAFVQKKNMKQDQAAKANVKKEPGADGDGLPKVKKEPGAAAALLEEAPVEPEVTMDCAEPPADEKPEERAELEPEGSHTENVELEAETLPAAPELNPNEIMTDEGTASEETLPKESLPPVNEEQEKTEETVPVPQEALQQETGGETVSVSASLPDDDATLPAADAAAGKPLIGVDPAVRALAETHMPSNASPLDVALTLARVHNRLPEFLDCVHADLEDSDGELADWVREFGCHEPLVELEDFNAFLKDCGEAEIDLTAAKEESKRIEEWHRTSFSTRLLP